MNNVFFVGENIACIAPLEMGSGFGIDFDDFRLRASRSTDLACPENPVSNSKQYHFSYQHSYGNADAGAASGLGGSGFTGIVSQFITVPRWFPEFKG